MKHMFRDRRRSLMLLVKIYGIIGNEGAFLGRMSQTAFAPGTVITNRNRLWRVDAQADDVLIATSASL
jgi:hypothetical protein